VHDRQLCGPAEQRVAVHNARLRRKVAGGAGGTRERAIGRAGVGLRPAAQPCAICDCW
jgi:hypothetical protein